MNRYVAFLILTAITFGSCKQVQKVSDVITQPSAREVYARDFEKTDTIYEEWDSAFAKAYQDSTSLINTQQPLNLPHTATGTYQRNYYKPYTYTFKLSRGEKFFAEVATTVDSTRVFLDLFKWKNDSVAETTPISSNEIAEKNITLDIKNTGMYSLIVQPEIITTAAFNIKLYTLPQYGFPVSGKGNKAVQSLWGAPRGGGKRSHKGIDIFAKRGTPVVAITDGIVSSTGNRGLGGKQVWLRDGIFGQSLYYAHLDSIIATTGQRVKAGDTLGLVGNTGNAKTTPPHLHFGIYGRGGAVDPYPFVKYRAIPEIKDSLAFAIGRLTTKANLRTRPTSKASKIKQLKTKDTVRVLEKSANWYLIEDDTNTRGYVYKSSMRPFATN